MRFGVYSLLLAVAAANGLLLAALLLLRAGRHAGSPWLAALTAGLALRVAPYILGFGGAYDSHPALTFIPFDLTLSWGPLLWIYVTTLATRAAPPGWHRHFVPAALQVAYQVVAFSLPLPLKLRWYRSVHLDVVEPLGALLVLASVALYGLAAWRVYDRWQAWLDANVSNREESRLSWLRVILWGFGMTGALGVGLVVVHLLVRPLDYFARLPVIVALGLLAYLIALLGYRHGGQAIPLGATAPDLPQPPVPPPMPSRVTPLHGAARPASDDEPSASGKDYAGDAAQWRERVIQEGWHRDSQLTLAVLAAALHVSTRSLSRALNEGLGESFNDFVNRVRVEEAVRRLAAPDAPDVLRVAYEVGFASKASFNRAFRRHAGTTPSEVRAEAQRTTAQDPPTA